LAVDVPTHLARRTLLIVVGMTIVGIAFNMWQSIISIPVIGAASVPLAFLGLLIIACGFMVHDDTALRRLEWAALAISIACVIGWSATTLYFSPSYGTDEVAFEQYAAQLVTHGVDPYGADLSGALDLFRVPIQYATYTMNGGMSAGLAYPDLSFLLIVPLLLLGVVSQAALIVNVLFFVLTMIVAFRVLPKHQRLLSVVLCAGVPVLFGYVVAGINTVLFMPFLLLAAHRWDRYHTLRGARAVVAPAAFGLACCVQQLPWFIAPFLIVGTFLEARAARSTRAALLTCARYTGIAIATFLLLNLPFIAWSPSRWMRGIVLPITQHAIPYGQGFVDLSAFFHIGGGRIGLYTDAALLLLAALLVVYVRYYRAMRYVTFFLPAIILFFASRSLAEYFSNLIIAGAVAALTLTRFEGAPLTMPRWLLPLACAPAAMTLTVALASPAPLEIRLTGFQTNGQLRAVQQLTAVVINHSDQTLTPHFAVNSAGQMTTFWNVTGGPATLRPHQSAVYTLIAPNLGSMPPVTSGFQVQAVTPTPETISTSRTIIPEQMSTQLTPGYINRPVVLGQTLHFAVQLRDHYGAPIRRAHVPVALGQIIYSQNALINGESTINDGNIGETPVIAATDARGIAHFTVTDTSVQSAPIYYESWVAQPNLYPYGYSSIVIVNWAQPPAAPPAQTAYRRTAHYRAAHHTRRAVTAHWGTASTPRSTRAPRFRRGFVRQGGGR